MLYKFTNSIILNITGNIIRERFSNERKEKVIRLVFGKVTQNFQCSSDLALDKNYKLLN